MSEDLYKKLTQKCIDKQKKGFDLYDDVRGRFFKKNLTLITIIW